MHIFQSFCFTWPLCFLSCCCITNPSVPGWCHVLCHRLALSYIMLSRASHYHPRGSNCIFFFYWGKKKKGWGGWFSSMRLKCIFIVKVLGPNKYPAFHSCTLTHGSQSIPGCNTKLNQQSAQQRRWLSDYVTLMQRPVGFTRAVSFAARQTSSARLIVSVSLSPQSSSLAQLLVALLWSSTSSAASGWRSYLSLTAWRA